MILMIAADALEWFKAIGTMAWPVLILIALIVFWKPVYDLIKQLQKAKLGPVEIELQTLAEKGTQAINSINQLHMQTERQMDDLASKGKEAVENIMRANELMNQSRKTPMKSLKNLSFIHIASTSNTSENFTTIDNPLINNNPNAILIVTQNWSPSTDKGRVYNPHPVGVWYTQDGKWSIFNEDRQHLPVGAAFNILVLD